ncbi:hypothetical protein X975_09749, partial [Stegodyphus mimosarum]
TGVKISVIARMAPLDMRIRRLLMTIKDSIVIYSVSACSIPAS